MPTVVAKLNIICRAMDEHTTQFEVRSAQQRCAQCPHPRVVGGGRWTGIDRSSYCVRQPSTLDAPPVSISAVLGNHRLYSAIYRDLINKPLEIPGTEIAAIIHVFFIHYTSAL